MRKSEAGMALAMSLKIDSKTIALTVIFVGVLMAAVDTTIVVLALPTIDLGLHTSPLYSIWVILTYIFVLAILSSQIGRLGDRYGKARIYKYGLVIFTVGSALCGLAPTIGFLIGSRVLQAVGGAIIGTASAAVISDHFEPHERGRAFGYTAIGWNFGAILGIFLGGALAVINWRLIFYINVPIGIIIAIIAFYKLKDLSEPHKEPFDMLGAVLLGITLLLLSYAASRVMFEGLAQIDALLFAASAAFAVAFIIREKRIKYPTINFSLFKNRVFKFSIIASMLQSTASFAILFMLILYLQGVKGLDPFTSSVFLLPGYLLGGIAAPYMGRLSDRIGARIPATSGLLLIGLGYVAYALFLGVGTPSYYVAIITILTGVGSAMFFPSNNSAIMANAPRDRYSMASGLNRMLGNVGMVLSFVVALTVVATAIPRSTAFAIFSGSSVVLSHSQGISFMHGLDAAFIASLAIILAATAMSFARGREDRQELTELNRRPR